MIRFQKSIQIPVLCHDPNLATEWCSLLKDAGLPVVQAAKSMSEDQWNRGSAVLLLHPDFDVMAQDSRLVRSSLKQVFILTGDQRWNELKKYPQIHFLPEHTHPLELARLMVEKLNLPVTVNKPTYAFSFFSF